MSQPRMIIRNGRIIDPANGVDGVGDVLIEDGCIAAVGAAVTDVRRDDVVHDANGCFVTPGLIDPHVHLREPGGEDQETIATGAAAAIHGGFTTVCCMPNTTPTLDNAALIQFVDQQARKANQARVFAVGAVTKGRKQEELAELNLMARAGAVAFSDDGDVVESPAMMAKAFGLIKPTGRCLMQHCQEPTLTQKAVMNAGATATKLGLAGWPAVAEELIIERDIRINERIGCRYHVQHLSCAGSVEIVRQARGRNQPVTAEAAPHHLLITDEVCLDYNTNGKVNPPLRTAADVEAVRQGVADGTITILATDHAPHTQEAKDLEFDAAPFGLVGIEFALPLYIKALIETGLIDWPRLVELLTINPARLCNLDQRTIPLGSLTPGAAGDVTIIDPHERWTIDPMEFRSKGRNTPFAGIEVTGRAVAVIVNGITKLDRINSESALVD